MTKKDRALAIIENLIHACNEGKVITFMRDYGGNTFTVYVDDDHFHTYAGNGTLDEVLKSLYTNIRGET